MAPERISGTIPMQLMPSADACQQEMHGLTYRARDASRYFAPQHCLSYTLAADGAKVSSGAFSFFRLGSDAPGSMPWIFESLGRLFSLLPRGLFHQGARPFAPDMPQGAVSAAYREAPHFPREHLGDLGAAIFMVFPRPERFPGVEPKWQPDQLSSPLNVQPVLGAPF